MTLEGYLIGALVILIPAALLALVTRVARRVFFVVGALLVWPGSELGWGGADNPVPFILGGIGLGICIGALLVEASVFLGRNLRRKLPLNG